VNITTKAAMAMNTIARILSCPSPRHSGCQIRNSPKCANIKGCAHGLLTPTSNTPCKANNIASNNQRPARKRLPIFSVSISSPPVEISSISLN
jgi:hypothetical protein